MRRHHALLKQRPLSPPDDEDDEMLMKSSRQLPKLRPSIINVVWPGVGGRGGESAGDPRRCGMLAWHHTLPPCVALRKQSPGERN